MSSSTTNSNSMDQTATKINDGNKTQTSAALIVQAYCTSVLQQPLVKIDDTDLKGLETKINVGLTTAQGHAKTYNNSILPTVIANVTNIDNFFQLQKAVPTTLPEGSTEAQWIATLKVLKNQAAVYQATAKSTADLLETLVEDLNKDTAAFSGIVQSLNERVNGDKGVLEQNQKDLDKIQADIDGAIAGAVASGLAIAGGVFLVAVGAIADLVTAGTSNWIVAGGVAVVAIGTGGEAGSVVALKALNNQKAAIITEDAQLKDEVKLASSISSAYTSLKNQVKGASTAATNMVNAWEFLRSDLGNLVTDLENGITSADAVRKLWLTTANSTIATVLKDTATIKTQLNGVKSVIASPDQKLNATLDEAVPTSSADKAAPMEMSGSVASTAASTVSSDTVTSENGTAAAALNMFAVETKTATAAVVLQAYTTLIAQQPLVDFGDNSDMKQYETTINDGLKIAKEHALAYDRTIRPAIISNITDIRSYYNLHKAVATSVPPDSTKDEWLKFLVELANQSTEYGNKAATTASQLEDLITELKGDQNNFSQYVSEMNSAIKGDKGALARLEDELKTVNSHIDGDITGVVLGSLTMLGGTIMIIVGAVADPVIVPCIIGGIGVTVAGTSTMIGTAVDWSNWVKKRNGIWERESTLKDEVKYTQTLKSSFDILIESCEKAIGAAKEMEAAWNKITTNLNDLADDLKSGVKTAGQVRTAFLNAAKNEIAQVLKDTDTIQAQMTGVTTQVDMSQPVDELVDDHLNETQALFVAGSFETLLSVPKSIAIPSSTGGSLTKNAAEFSAAANQVFACSGLPPEATSIQDKVPPIAKQVKDHVKQVQSASLTFAETTSKSIEEALSVLGQKDARIDSTVEKILQQIQADTSEMETLFSNTMKSFQSSQSQVNEMVGDLAQVRTDIKVKCAGVQSKLDTKKMEEAAAKKKYETLHWVAVGLSVIGIGVLMEAALDIYIAATQEVQHLDDEVNTLNRQVSSLESMENAIGSFRTKLSSVGFVFNNLQNSITVVFGDIKNIKTDGSGDTAAEAYLKLMAAKQELISFKADAS